MKTKFPSNLQFLFAVGLVVCVFGPQAGAQTSAQLAIQTYPGLTITGSVGTVYSIEYLTDFGQTNTWRCLEFLQLTANPYVWTDKSAPVTDRRFYRAEAFTAPGNLVFIPPGTFRMGSPTNEVDRDTSEGPQTAVTISRGFWMGKYPVTQGEYQTVIGSNPSFFIGTRSGIDYGTNLTRPVEQLKWADAKNYCTVRTQQEQAAGWIPSNSVYRLPTEAEWEYACRGWTSTRFSYGDDLEYTSLTNYAWYADNSGHETHPVGLKLPNPWGLYDMHGNVYQWCQDWYGPYPGGIALDPQGPLTPFVSELYIYRGGNWLIGGKRCRSASRGYGFIDFDPQIGFRVVLSQAQ